MTGSKDNHEDEMDKIIKEVEKSGFPLELTTTSTLQDKGWEVENNVEYFNQKTKEYSEIDIVARKKSIAGNFIIVLIVECKKSTDKPWLFFRYDRIKIQPDMVKFVAIDEALARKKVEQFGVHHTLYSGRICKKGIILHANNEKRKDIDKASSQVLDALEFYLYRERWRLGNASSHEIIILYPLIVFDGKLYSASLKEKKTVVDEEKRVLRHISRDEFRPNVYGEDNRLRLKRHVIDFVHKEELPNLLGMIEKCDTKDKEVETIQREIFMGTK